MPTVALIGAAHIHTPNFIDRLKRRPSVNVKYVWDHQAARAQRAADALSAQLSPDPQTIYRDAEVEAVIICSETDRHEALVMPAVAAGKHLFVEKPLGFNARDARLMASAIEEAGVLFQTGYFMRSDPVHRFVKGQLELGHFGTVTRARFSNCHAGSLGGWFDSDWRWMTDPTIAGCGAFGDLGTHALDLLLWLFGEVDEVTASIKVVTERYGPCDESGEGLLRFASGVTGSLAAGWVDVANPITLLVSGTEGHAYVLGGELYYQSEQLPGADAKTPWTDLPEPLPHAFELFLDALEGKDVPLVRAYEAAYRNTVMDALYQAAEARRWVSVKAS